ncbi:MAG: 23S rRNA (adenine(2503)-C(2))-methyltransferase RlmN [Propionibacteriaceae bacterium]|jgi:23S rRNA (adenine2503-C2)-methyltransferase|nr:23S rRNA (adenine(2503)-C(2))-methyltransferase RlmN [Propionibacteriaceae bacterium]
MSDPTVPLRLMAPTPPRGKPPRHWADLTVPDRLEAVARAGLPSFRAKQIAAHYCHHLSGQPADWTDLSVDHRHRVADLFPELLHWLGDRQCDDGATVKSLYRLFDGELVETVLMRYGLTEQATVGPRGLRSTLCVSSQAGCGMACPFCATGQLGLRRNLSTAEIVEQIRLGARCLADGALPGGPGRLHNVVFMGMGEPLANYRSVLAAIRQTTAPAPAGFGLSARGLTVSTCGLVPAIEKLSQEGLPVTLAVSLHAPDDDLRDRLVPVNRRWPVARLLDAAWGYAQATGRRVSIEYALMRDLNDQPARADHLAELLRARGHWGWFHVNLIPLNRVPGSPWTASRRRDQDAFRRRLEATGVPVTVRDSRGQEIDGACGQLAANWRQTEPDRPGPAEADHPRPDGSVPD